MQREYPHKYSYRKGVWVVVLSLGSHSDHLNEKLFSVSAESSGVGGQLTLFCSHGLCCFVVNSQHSIQNSMCSTHLSPFLTFCTIIVPQISFVGLSMETHYVLSID